MNRVEASLTPTESGPLVVLIGKADLTSINQLSAVLEAQLSGGAAPDDRRIGPAVRRRVIGTEDRVGCRHPKEPRRRPAAGASLAGHDQHTEGAPYIRHAHHPRRHLDQDRRWVGPGTTDDLAHTVANAVAGHLRLV